MASMASMASMAQPRSSVSRRISMTGLTNLKTIVSEKFSPPIIETSKDVPFEYAIFCRNWSDEKWLSPHAKDIPKDVNAKVKYPGKGPDGQYPIPEFGAYKSKELCETESLNDLVSKYDPLEHLKQVLDRHGCEYHVTPYEPEKLKSKSQGNRWIVFVRLSEEKIDKIIASNAILDPMSGDQNDHTGQSGGPNVKALNSSQRNWMLDQVLTDPEQVHIRIFQHFGGFVFVEHFCIIHDRQVNNLLFKSMVYVPFLQFNQIQTIRSHFGEKIAFYFAWLDFYNRMLGLLAICGLALYMLGYVHPDLYQKLLPFFGILTLVWGTSFNNLWRRRERELALIWQVTSEHAGMENRRYEYLLNTTTVRKSPVTGEQEKHFAGKARLVRYVVSVLVFMCQALLLVFLTSLIYLHSVWAYFEFADNPALQQFHTTYVNTGMYVLLIALANYTAVVYVGKSLTQWENHPTDERYDSMLSNKIFSFYFLDGFLWYIILAFIQIPLTGTETMNNFLHQFNIDISRMKIDHPLEYRTLQSEEYWMKLLETTIIGYFTMSQFIPIIIESTVPVLLRRFKNKVKRIRTNLKTKKKSDTGDVEMHSVQTGYAPQVDSDDDQAHDVEDEADTNSQHSKEPDPRNVTEYMKWHIYSKDTTRSFDKLRQQAKREPMELYDDYEDMILEYGYVLIFTVLWPLVPLLALINNMLEVRGDFFRMIHTSRRVAFSKARGIGVYQDHLNITTDFAVVMTLGLVMVATHNMDVYFGFFRGTSYETVVFDLDPETGKAHTRIWIRFLIAVIVEHLIFTMQRLISALTPGLPKWVKYEQERLEHKLRTRLIATQAQ